MIKAARMGLVQRLVRKVKDRIGLSRPKPQQRATPKTPLRLAAPGELVSFENILLMPALNGKMPGQYINDAGPVWPQFAKRTDLRFYRDSRVRDRRPPAPVGPVEKWDEELLWGGCIVQQFGHMVSETIPRLFASAMARPDLRIALVAPEPGWPAVGPDYLLTILEWLGIDPARLVFVEKPVRVARLWAMPQPEVLDGPAPSAAYLALYDENARRQGLILRPEGRLFVTRASSFQSGRGGLVGESYLTACLARLGVEILDAGAASIRQQMEAYAKAKTLIFVEGSAQIGRQLLGFIPQDIHVLHRRPGSRLVEHTLGARCDNLTFVDPIRAMAVPHREGVYQPDYLAPAFVDVAVLHRFFTGLGVDVSADWNAADFDRAQWRDVGNWWKGYRRNVTGIAVAKTAGNMFVALKQTGLWHDAIPERPDQVLDRLAPEWQAMKDMAHV